MAYISNLAVQRVGQALQSVRIFVPDVENALVQKFGGDWPNTVGKLFNQKLNIDLHDTRFLLKILGWRYDNGKGERLISISGIDPVQAQRLLNIAHLAQHQRSDPRWNEGDDIEAERIAASFLVATGKRRQRAVASIPGRHEELFELSDKCIRHRWYPADLADPNSSWSKWHEMECSAATSVAATGQDDRIDIFILTTTGIVEHRTWELDGSKDTPPRERDGRWSNWRGLPNGGLTVGGPISAVSLSEGHLELFAFGENMETVHRWSWNEKWENWQPFDRS